MGAVETEVGDKVVQDANPGYFNEPNKKWIEEDDATVKFSRTVAYTHVNLSDVREGWTLVVSCMPPHVLKSRSGLLSRKKKMTRFCDLDFRDNYCLEMAVKTDFTYQYILL